ncbi:hypothetical protein HDR70_00330 [bacterium]|nr:hypothetical protein [bacterium]
MVFTINHNLNIVREQLEELHDELMQAQADVLLEVSKNIKNDTLSNIRGLFKHSNSSRYNDNIEDGVRVIKFKRYSDNTVETGAHILGVRDRRSGTFRLRFFEGGTVQRQTKKNKNRGSIQARNFFKQATDKNIPTIEAMLNKKYNDVINEYNRK